MAAQPSRAFLAFVQEWSGPVEQALLELLPPKTAVPQRLHEAMHYALFPGGKRLRPMLVLLGCRALGGDCKRALRAAAALECLHTYSLVHDDLPCMDDDDLRRGRPACHKVYGEALALLAGDALLTLAMEGAASAGAPAVAELARAAGSLGMVGGQVEDLAAEREPDRHDLARVQWIHDHKTGALITASLLVGAHAGAGEAGPPAAALGQLRRFGDLLGRAFQIADDCLDLTGTAHELGKNPLADVARGKLTWPAIVGLEQSLATARQLAAEASLLAAMVVAAASQGPGPGPTLDAAVGLLQDAASYAVERRR
ncbi:MAG TPA: farnesyl diphosphate synthase [Planctomycetota bacterium]|nr:farnesyl diphosphate synthase [Planctomycetota bacterium]